MTIGEKRERRRLTQRVYRAKSFLRKIEFTSAFPETSPSGVLKDLLEIERTRRRGKGRRGYTKSAVKKLDLLVKEVKKQQKIGAKKGLSKKGATAFASFRAVKKFASRRKSLKKTYRQLNFSKGRLLQSLKDLNREDFYVENKDQIISYNEARSEGTQTDIDIFGKHLKEAYSPIKNILSADRKILKVDENFEMKELQKKFAKQGDKIEK